MKKVILFGILSLVLTFQAHAYIWAKGVPSALHIFPSGIVVVGSFDLPGVTCATGQKAIWINKTDENYDHKVTTANTARLTKSMITVLIADPVETSCVEVSGLGPVPVAYYYYWIISD